MGVRLPKSWLYYTHGKRQKLDSAIVLAKGDSKFQALIELFVSCL